MDAQGGGLNNGLLQGVPLMKTKQTDVFRVGRREKILEKVYVMSLFSFPGCHMATILRPCPDHSESYVEGKKIQVTIAFNHFGDIIIERSQGDASQAAARNLIFSLVGRTTSFTMPSRLSSIPSDACHLTGVRCGDSIGSLASRSTSFTTASIWRKPGSVLQNWIG